MSTHKSIDRICVAIVAFTLVIALIFCSGSAFGLGTTAHAIGYEDRLFDHSRVHTVDIVIDNWDGFIDTCENEEYSRCNVIIDGEAVRDVGIRGKGNTSLSSVRAMNSSRYSFKIEFDQYDSTKSYHGLDKLCLNNIIQDNTYMKDYLAYTLMNDFDADAPLCSYAYITVNGEDWGLYLAVEAVEDSFLRRNYGTDGGDLYKPDSMGFGGGRGNGRDFSMSDFMDEDSDSSDDQTESSDSSPQDRGGFGRGEMPDFRNGEMPDFRNGEMPDFRNGEMPDFGGGMPGGGNGRGSDDVKLKYTDDNEESYSNIFGNAKTPVNTADKKRLISSLKALSEQAELENTVDTDEVIRYFVVHDFLCNGDSYTGEMIHNYYLYEKDGQLSMIPWDYNLAFGTFHGGNASSSVNSPIDSPVSGDMSDRPMVAWIFSDEKYTEQYHQLFAEFLNNADFEQLIGDAAALIDEYVEKDPTKFCTYDEYRKGVEAIGEFCRLREESIRGQLSGDIPSTSDGQKADSSSLVDVSDLDLSAMGSMGGGDRHGGFGGRNDADRDSESSDNEITLDAAGKSVKKLSSFMLSDTDKSTDRGGMPQGRGGRQGGSDPPDAPDGFDPSNMPDGFAPPDAPDGFDPSNMPDGFAPPDAPDGFGQEDTYVEQTETTSVSQDNEQSTTAVRQGNLRMERPEGSFPEMNPEKTDRNAVGTLEAVLLGVSAMVLLAGIIFALRFRR